LIKLPVIEGIHLLCFSFSAHDYRPQRWHQDCDGRESRKDQRAMKQRREGYLPGERLDVTIERIVPGGEGLARGPKGIILVEQSAPGDQLEIEIVSRRGGAARGRILSIRQAGVGRIDPPCQWYGRCGGCDFQHLRYDSQLEAKEALLRDALRRIGGIDWDGPIERFAAPHPFGSRARVELHSDPISGTVGFYARRSNEVVPIDRCLVSRPEIDDALQTIRNSGMKIPPALHLIAGNGTVHCSPEIPGLPSGPFWMTIDPFDYLVDPAGFFQSSFDLLPLLIERVVGSAGDERRCAWDLYCGGGLFSFPLARLFDEVVGVEFDPTAVEHSTLGAARNGIGNARFVAEDVERWVASRHKRSVQPDLVVVDPPRTGLGQVLSTRLAELRPPRLTYVACDPAALARDLALLTANGLRIRDIALFDLFPQTHHVETVVRLAAESSR
jgi:23S rRNA (uracil1939-C5)-methyltransferase